MSAKVFLRTLSVVHLSLLGGLVGFAIFAYWQHQGYLALMDTYDVYIYLVPIFAALGYFGSKYIFQNILQRIKQDDEPQHKLKKYQIASIIKYVLVEAPAFFALIAYYLSGNAMHLMVGISMMAYLYSQRPTLKRFLKELPLSLEEQKQFDTLNP